MAICIYPPHADDFSTNGLGILTPIECTAEEAANGKYELTLIHPIDNTLRWAQIGNGCILKAPVPVRETPLYEAPATDGDTTVTRQIWEVTGTSHGLYLRSGPGMSYPRIGKRRNGDEIIELEDAEDPWKKVCVAANGAVGYMSTKYLKPIRTEIQQITPGKLAGGTLKLAQSRDQLFRIYSVEQDTENHTVTAKAMHIFYDESGNIIDDDYRPDDIEVNAAIAHIKENLHQSAAIAIQPINLEGSISGSYAWKSPVEALLEPEKGILAQVNGLLVRDNFEAYLIADNVRDRGVTIRRGKNLMGVTATNDVSGVVTRIIPVGKDKKGEPLYLEGTKYVDSPHIDTYPFPRIQRIEYDVQVVEKDADGKTKFSSENAAREKLLVLAEADFSENGVDLPVYGMEVDFIMLGNTLEYADYASLQAVHLFDTVTVIDELIGLKAKVRVTGYTWNCLTKQYETITLGEIQDMQYMVYSYNLPDAGISGTKIMPNSIGGGALRNMSIEYAKITNAAIQQLSANAITALTAHINEIVADKITTDELYAAYAELIALKVGSIKADDIETDSLAAALAEITVLIAGTASFDRATIQHLVAEAMNLEFGVAGQVFIKNLAVEYAQMVGATIAELCIKASDGNYYLLDVNEDGGVTATQTTVTNGEIAEGQTGGGKVIVETNMTVKNLNTSNLLATYALINKIDAAAIDVDELFAREAFISLLRTSRIIGDKSITMIANEAGAASRCFRQTGEPTGADGVKPGDIWIVPDSGQVFQAEAVSDTQLQYAIDRDGNLYATDVEGISFTVDGFDLYVSGAEISENPDGTLTQPFVWVLVQDEDILNSIAENKYNLERVVRIDSDGLHVGDNQTPNEVLIDSNSVNIKVAGKTFSKFADRYVQFGNYKIGLAEDDGLMFKPAI